MSRRKELIIISILLGLFLGFMSCKEEKEQAPSAIKLSWESTPSRSAWSKTLMEIINQEWGRIEQASDMNIFCPKYYGLSEETKKIAFAEVIVWTSFYESTWNQIAWMTESSMGIDAITKRQVRSEGLMQMSYQDTQWAKYCEFDWSLDKYLDENDYKKTIFDPHKNLKCAVQVMSRQIARTKKIVLPRGHYWAVLRDPTLGRYSKVYEISSRVSKQLKDCTI